ncbi:protease modulator HflC, partial [Candidatus Aerophobetes bacterium]|nr:protease modulator HflC [Candidatus Aerophobetes bacterium]
MRIEKWIIYGAVIIVGIIILSNSLYVVDETQQVVITEFGRPVGEPIKK